MKIYMLDKDMLINLKTLYFPFGFGLSYSTFEFSELMLECKKKLTVRFKVKNILKYDASVVPMIFLDFPFENYPKKVFKGFDKKSLKIYEVIYFYILVEPYDLSYYDVSKKE